MKELNLIPGDSTAHPAKHLQPINLRIDCWEVRKHSQKVRGKESFGAWMSSLLACGALFPYVTFVFRWQLHHEREEAGMFSAFN